MRVAIIGAGIGGLAVAARLARAGHEVTVLEKTARPGGRASRIQGAGFSFDAGPSLLLRPDTLHQTYADLGERMEDHLDLVRVEPACRVHFPEGSTLDLGSDPARLRDQLDHLEPGAFCRVLACTGQDYERDTTALERVVEYSAYRAVDRLSLRNVAHRLRKSLLRTRCADSSRCFRDPRLRAAFSFLRMYPGLNPLGVPLACALLPFTAMAEGVWYPRGGMYAVVSSLRRLAEGYGAWFYYDAPVRRIVHDGDAARGVALENRERLGADVVVANADLPYVYHVLLQDGQAFQRCRRHRSAASAFTFHWGVAGEPSPLLLHHNVFLEDDRRPQAFDRVLGDHDLPGAPSFYVHAPARTVAGLAPPSADALTVVVPTGHLSTAAVQDWPALQARVRECVIARLQASGISRLGERIVYERTLAPPDYEATWNLTGGAALGPGQSVARAGYRRPANRHPRIGNVYFAGASTHLGAGVPTVLISARLAVERILKEQPPD